MEGSRHFQSASGFQSHGNPIGEHSTLFFRGIGENIADQQDFHAKGVRGPECLKVFLAFKVEMMVSGSKVRPVVRLHP